MYKFLLFFLGLPLLIACGQTESIAQTPQAGWVVGKVVDQQGRPVAGAKIFVRYQSFGGGRAGRYGGSIGVDAVTGPNGTYRAKVGNLAPGEYNVTGKAIINQDGQRIEMDLTPEDSSNFASTSATVRNFRVGYAETTEDSNYGTGGMVLVDNGIGDYTPREEVQLILIPANGGAPITRPLRNTGEGWVATGLPFGTYEVMAKHNGRAMLIKGKNGEWGNSYVGKFERFGPGIYQIRVEVKSR